MLKKITEKYYRVVVEERERSSAPGVAFATGRKP